MLILQWDNAELLALELLRPQERQAESYQMHQSLSLVLILLLACESPTEFAVALWDVLDLLAAEAVAANGSVSAASECLVLVLEALAWEQEHELACLDSLVLVQLAVLETTVHLVNQTLASCPLDHTSSSLGLSLVVVVLVVPAELVVNLPVSVNQACPHHRLASWPGSTGNKSGGFSSSTGAGGCGGIGLGKASNGGGDGGSGTDRASSSQNIMTEYMEMSNLSRFNARAFTFATYKVLFCFFSQNTMPASLSD